MKRKALLLLTLMGLMLPALAQRGKRPLTSTEVKGIIKAVEDEIYDLDDHGEFYQLGDNLGTPQHWKSRMHIYINPQYNQKENIGEIVYKFMPYGEIFRIFFIDENGQIKLDGDPHNHFPLSQPSHMTIFMDDEDICRIKQSWLKDFFVVDVSPTQEMIEAAARRQKDRTGFSDWEYRHSHSKNR